MTEKRCVRCGQYKSHDQFYKRGNGSDSFCINCRRDYMANEVQPVIKYCTICNKPFVVGDLGNNHQYCAAHAVLATKAQEVRKDLAGCKTNRHKTMCALECYESMSEEGKNRMSFYIAAVVANHHEHCRKKKKKPSLGNISAYELVYGMIEAGYLKERT